MRVAFRGFKYRSGYNLEMGAADTLIRQPFPMEFRRCDAFFFQSVFRQVDRFSEIIRSLEKVGSDSEE